MVLEDLGVCAEDVLMTSSLVSDLGMESMRFVDLTIMLEDMFGFPFPMQQWIDAELAAGVDGFRVRSLVALSERLLSNAALAR